MGLILIITGLLVVAGALVWSLDLSETGIGVVASVLGLIVSILGVVFLLNELGFFSFVKTVWLTVLAGLKEIVTLGGLIG